MDAPWAPARLASLNAPQFDRQEIWRSASRDARSRWSLPTSSQLCVYARSRAARVKVVLVTTMLLVQPWWIAPATTSWTADTPTGWESRLHWTALRIDSEVPGSSRVGYVPSDVAEQLCDVVLELFASHQIDLI